MELRLPTNQDVYLRYRVSKWARVADFTGIGMLPTVIRFLILLLATHLTTGCAITYNIKQDILPTSIESALVQQWPLTVGLFVPASVRSTVIAKDAWRVPIGSEAKATLLWALSQMFTNVIEIDTPPSKGMIRDGLAGVIELSDISYLNTLSGGLQYKIKLYSPKGEEINQWSLMTTGMNWDIEESSLSSLMQAKGSELTYCIRDLTAQFMVNFSRSSEIDSWLTSCGITPLAKGPAFRERGGITEQKTSVVLLVPNMSKWLHTDASRGMDCVGHRLGKMTPAIKVIPIETVRLEFFPWLELSTAPKTEEEIQRWLSEPAIQQKARSLGARYLLEFHGGTNTTWSGGILCGGGYGGGAGCLGFSWGDRNSSFSATILDMWTGSKLSGITTQKSGQSYIPAFILPIPIISPTEGKACEEVSQRIHRMIINKRP